MTNEPIATKTTKAAKRRKAIDDAIYAVRRMGLIVDPSNPRESRPSEEELLSTIRTLRAIRRTIELPSPDQLVDAKHDPIHPTSGNLIRSKKLKVR